MKFKFLIPLTLLSLLFFSCDKDEPVVPTEITFDAQTFEVLETIGQDEEVGTVVATSNSTEELSFRIVENPGELFVIQPGGRIDKSSPLLLNSNDNDSHVIIVEATDGKVSTTATITINVINVPDPFVTTWKTNNPGSSASNQVTISIVDGLSYDYTVDWGDGNMDENVTSHITHTYAAEGTYSVSISGTFPGIFSNHQNDADKLLSVDQWGEIEWTTMVEAFNHCDNLNINATDAPDLSQVTSMQQMFTGARAVNADLSNWDVSNVTNMANMFNNARSFNGDISTWDVSNVTTMYYMFRDARSFNQDLNNWDVSSVTTMNTMFYYASSFNGDISNWDVSSVTDMNQMFREAGQFNGDISNWDVSSVTNMNFLFDEAGSFNSDISNWDVGQVTQMYNTFEDAGTFDQDLSSWNVSNVTHMNKMFDDSGLSTTNYNALLVGWSAQTMQSNVSFSAGNIRYGASAQSGRDILTNTYNWTITDGGVR